jgi:hypothetical protein
MLSRLPFGGFRRHHQPAARVVRLTVAAAVAVVGLVAPTAPTTPAAALTSVQAPGKGQTVEAHGTLSIPTPGLQPTVRSLGGYDTNILGQPVNTPGHDVPVAPVVLCNAYAEGEHGAMAVVEGVTPGRVFGLTADAGTWQDDFDVVFFASFAACRSGADNIDFRVHAGDEHSIVPDGAGVALVTLNSGAPPASFTYRELGADQFKPGKAHRSPTVVAVIEAGGYSPYHYDFLGSQHPWNTNVGSGDDIDFTADPVTYIPAYPGATPINLALPKTPDENVVDLAGQDRAKWDAIAPSTSSSVNLYRLPGTKVVGAVRFGNTGAAGIYDWDEGNTGHGTHSAASAAGNIHGTCPECVFVLIKADSITMAVAAEEWVSTQPWIDVVTNSILFSTGGDCPSSVACGVWPYPPMYNGLRLRGEEVPYLKAATEDGQEAFWAAGNGLDDDFVAPQSTYWSSDAGPDWTVTVGAVGPKNDQAYNGAGKPVDIAAYGDLYPSAGGTTANGTGGHSGTSNATPVVAGTYARIIQVARDALGDDTPGHHGGIVAEGLPRPCPAKSDSCPLADGKLERSEAEAILFHNVLPSPVRQPETDLPRSSGTWAALRTAGQGHGIVYGVLDRARFVAEQRKFSDAVLGLTSAAPRPPHEVTWLTTDSKCRQRLWGEWAQGYYHATTWSPPNPSTDPDAAALDGLCSQVYQDAFAKPLPAPSVTGLLNEIECGVLNNDVHSLCGG